MSLSCDTALKIYLQTEIRVKTIFDAIYNGDLDWIKYHSLNNKQQLNQRQEGKSPLYYAAKYGKLEFVKWFVNEAKDIDINDGSDDGANPLFVACCNGYVDIVKVLLSHPKCDYNKLDSSGWIALYNACTAGKYNVVLELLKLPDLNINHMTNLRFCGLATACQTGYIDIVRALLNRINVS